MEDNRKKLRECPLAVLASTVKPCRVSPHMAQGPRGSWKQLAMCLDVAVQWLYHWLVWLRPWAERFGQVKNPDPGVTVNGAPGSRSS